MKPLQLTRQCNHFTHTWMMCGFSSQKFWNPHFQVFLSVNTRNYMYQYCHQRWPSQFPVLLPTCMYINQTWSIEFKRHIVFVLYARFETNKYRVEYWGNIGKNVRWLPLLTFKNSTENRANKISVCSSYFQFQNKSMSITSA